jgi:hypothetical protein
MIVFSKGSKEGRNDFVSFTWEDKITKNQRKKVRRTGETFHINRGLFKKVYTVNEDGVRVPLIQESMYKDKNGQEIMYYNYVYKAINAWGDSFRAQEFYGKNFPLDPLSTTSRPSVLDNGFIKVAREVEDTEIELALLGTTPSIEKPENIAQEEWDGLSDEEKIKIKEC